MLSVNINQERRKICKICACNWDTSNPRPTFSAFLQYPSQKNSAIFRFNAMFIKPICRLAVVCTKEKGSGNACFMTSRANYRNICFSTNKERQCPYQYGFTCTGFTRKNCKSTIKFYIFRFNDCKIFYGKIFKHEDLLTS